MRKVKRNISKKSKIAFILVTILFFQGCNFLTLKIEGNASGKSREEALKNAYSQTINNAQMIASDYTNKLFKKSIKEAKLDINDIKILKGYSKFALTSGLENLDKTNMDKYVSISKNNKTDSYQVTISYTVIKWHANEAIFNYIRSDLGLYTKLEKSKHFLKLDEKY